MGLSFRKTKKIAPGVRVTESKSGVSVSAGNKVAGISKSSSDRTTKCATIPGTGITWRKTKSKK